MIISIASSKGGVGKSTLTTCLAGAWAAAHQSVHIVDLDYNRTVTRWLSGTAKQTGITLSTPSDPGELSAHLETIIAENDPDVILIDVAGSYERALTHAVARAHLTLIPASATEADIFEASRIARHIDAVFKSFNKTPLYRLVLNRIPSLTSSGQLFTMRELIRLKLSRLKTRVMQRAAYEEVGLSGLPPHFADLKRPTVAKAVEELNALRGDIDAVFADQNIQNQEGAAA